MRSKDTPSKQAIGLLGGTFDPIHYGHLRLAEEMAEALGLGGVHLLPAGTPPHRPPPQAPAADRLAMVRLAIAGNPRFRLDTHEIGNPAPCYMVETLAALRAELGDKVAIVLFLGSDAFAGLTAWHEWPRLFDLAHIAVAERPGHSVSGWEATLPPPLVEAWQTRLADQPGELCTAPSGRLIRHAITQLDISASRLRRLLANGQSARYLLPDDVLDYIHQHRLYQ